jgi:hypothetical protein
MSEQKAVITTRLRDGVSVGTIGDTENWADVSFSCQNF